MSDAHLNNMIWDAIVEHNNNKDTIDLGIKWMEGVVRRNPTYANHYDTYAWLLYKRGYRERAIEMEEKAVSLGKYEPDTKMFRETLKKMQDATLISN